jgi:phage baseplate assembly protein W
MAQRFFTGFSTTDSVRTRQRTFYDIELCKRDLMNHFFTRVGERVMRSNWGCSIWNYLMEPFTPSIKNQISAEAVRIVTADPRCKLVALNIVEFNQGIRVELTLSFDPMSVIDTMVLDFERREAVRWDGGF